MGANAGVGLSSLRPDRLSDDFVDAAGYYGQKTRDTVNQFKDGLRSARDSVTSAWRNR